MTSKGKRGSYLAALCRTVPYHIVEEVLREPSERAIRNRFFDGSVVFTDLVGFTPLCERLAHSGEDGLGRLSRVLNELFGTLIEDAIFPYNGYIVQFGGDSITTFFRGEGNAQGAAAAALTMQRLMFGELGRLVEGQNRELMLRVGVGCGDIRLLVLGDLTRRAAVVAGKAAIEAQEMQKLAEPNSIVCSDEFIERAGRDLEIVNRAESHGVLRGLRSWPQRRAFVPLGDRLDEQVEEKVMLLEPFVPPALASRLESAPKGWRIDGELRNVTIVFSELWGVDEDRGGEQVALSLSRSMLRAFRRYGGTIMKVDLADRGHRTLVLFGLHDPSANDSERALLAAFEATARIRSYGASNSLDVGIRLGAHSGTVYYGAIGSDAKHDITVVGDAVNVAARAVSQAAAFEVIATERVLANVGHEFRASDRGPIRIKGKSKPVRLYVVHGPNEDKSHFAQARSATRSLQGRSPEGDRLRRVVEEAMNGRGSVIGICGEPGSGKSAILGPILDRWILRGGTAVVARCRYASSGIPLAPIVSMFENFLGITGGDGEQERRERIREGLKNYSLPDGAPELVALLQPVRRQDGSTEALVDLADSHARERVLGSITRFLEQRFREEPRLYVVEDLHQADTLTLQLAMRLWALGRQWPFLMIGTYRPDPLLDDLRKTVDLEIGLTNLSLHDSSQLIARELGAESVDPDLAVFIWERTRGNPGYLLELLRFFRDRGLLQVRAAVVVAEVGVKALDNVVPSSLAQVALSGINHLGEVERRVLRTAAAIGRRFGGQLLRTITAGDIEADLVEEAVLRLEGGRVFAADQNHGAGYMFRDDVTRAVAYSTIPDSDRRSVHRRIADALERLPAEDHSRSAAALAHHRERGGQPREAAMWYERAARLATRAALDREARFFAERWEEVCKDLEAEDKPAIQLRSRMAVLRFLAIARQGVPNDTVDAGRQIDEKIWGALDDNSRAAVDYWIGVALVGLGRPEKARERLIRAYESGARDHLRSDAACLIARTHSQSHEIDEAREWLSSATALAGDDEYRRVRISLGAAFLLMSEGDLEEARALFEAARRAARSRDHLLIAASATSQLAHVDLLDARFAEARSGYEESIVLHRAVGRWAKVAKDLVGLGQTFVWVGRFDEAIEPLERALSIARDLGDELSAAAAFVHLGVSLAMTRDPLDGLRMVEDGYRRAVRGGVREAEIAADLHLLQIALAQRDERAVDSAMKRCLLHRSRARSRLFARVFADLQAKAVPFVGS